MVAQTQWQTQWQTQRPCMDLPICALPGINLTSTITSMLKGNRQLLPPKLYSYLVSNNVFQIQVTKTKQHLPSQTSQYEDFLPWASLLLIALVAQVKKSYSFFDSPSHWPPTEMNELQVLPSPHPPLTTSKPTASTPLSPGLGAHWVLAISIWNVTLTYNLQLTPAFLHSNTS